MEKLNSILQKSIATNGTATDKLLGAAFIVVNKDGTSLTLVTPILTAPDHCRNSLSGFCRSNHARPLLAILFDRNHRLGCLHV